MLAAVHNEKLVSCNLGSETEATKLIHVGGCPVVSSAICPDSKYIKFNLFTRTNPVESQIVDLSADNLLKTNFNAANPTKVIIHGFIGNITGKELVELRTQYLLHGEYNLIAVDWSVLAAGVLCYPTAIENAKHVGACVAQLVQRLRTAPTEDIHVVGHSLGAQMGGFIANHLKPYQLPRITGLDPAGPGFRNLFNDYQLDSSDAIFVDILHTNILVFGKPDPCGHVDFYFNRDADNQPGCGVKQLCSHYRAIEFFAESVNTDTGFYGQQCANLMSFSLGLCGASQRTILMGEHILNSTRGIVSVSTSATSPYALGR